MQAYIAPVGRLASEIFAGDATFQTGAAGVAYLNRWADVPERTYRYAMRVLDQARSDNNLLMQTIADVLDIPVVRPMMAETVALGAAYAAGLAVGYWTDLEVLRGNWHRAAA